MANVDLVIPQPSIGGEVVSLAAPPLAEESPLGWDLAQQFPIQEEGLSPPSSSVHSHIPLVDLTSAEESFADFVPPKSPWMMRHVPQTDT